MLFTLIFTPLDTTDYVEYSGVFGYGDVVLDGLVTVLFIIVLFITVLFLLELLVTLSLLVIFYKNTHSLIFSRENTA